MQREVILNTFQAKYQHPIRDLSAACSLLSCNAKSSIFFPKNTSYYCINSLISQTKSTLSSVISNPVFNFFLTFNLSIFFPFKKTYVSHVRFLKFIGHLAIFFLLIPSLSLSFFFLLAGLKFPI